LPYLCNLVQDYAVFAFLKSRLQDAAEAVHYQVEQIHQEIIHVQLKETTYSGSIMLDLIISQETPDLKRFMRRIIMILVQNRLLYF
jgi:hypothetical protein